MKTLYLKILLIALLTTAINAQTDSIIKAKSINCLINKKCFKKNPIFKNIELVDDSVEINKVKSIIFINNDSLHLIKTQSKVYALNLKDLREVNIKSGTQWFAGLTLGFLVGGLVGAAISPSSSNSMSYNPATGWEPIAGGIIGAAVLGTIGAIIGSSFDDYETLNLSGITAKDKKTELIKFLRQK